MIVSLVIFGSDDPFALHEASGASETCYGTSDCRLTEAFSIYCARPLLDYVFRGLQTADFRGSLLLWTSANDGALDTTSLN